MEEKKEIEKNKKDEKETVEQNTTVEETTAKEEVKKEKKKKEIVEEPEESEEVKAMRETGKKVRMAAIVGCIFGVVLTVIFGFLLDYKGYGKLKNGSDIVATVDGKKVTAADLYAILKEENGRQAMLNEIDEYLLDQKYPLSEKDKEDAKEDAEEYIEYYKNYGYSQESFLEENGFKSYDEFVEYMEYQIQARKYFFDYLEGRLEQGAVQKYFDENKEECTQYDTEHILVKITETVPDEQALALINEILGKVNEGKSFEDIVSEYGDKVVHEELGFQGAKSSLEESFLTVMLSMEENSYSKEPVKTSYGYHIIHKRKAATLEDLRENILNTLSSDYIQDNQNFQYAAIDALRKEFNLKIYDEDIEKNYNEYLKSKLKENSDSVKVGE